MKRELLLIIIFLLFTYITEAASGTIIKEQKIVNKLVKISRNDRLVLDNSFGDITINTWKKNEVSLVVTITARSFDKNRVRLIMDNTRISEIIHEQENNKISFKTTFTPAYHNINGILDPTENDRGMELIVDYVVYMPENSSLDVTALSGNVYFKDDFTGTLWLNISNGCLKANALTGDVKYISIQHTREYKSAILYLDNAHLNGVDNAIIEKASNIRVRDCNSLSIRYAKYIDISGVNNNLHISSVDNLYGSLQKGHTSCDIDIDTIKKGADLIISNCNVNINNFGKFVERISIYSQNSILQLDFNKPINMYVDLDIDSSYDISTTKIENIPPSLILDKTNSDDYHNKYKGSFGNTNGELNITATGGRISF